MITEAVSPLLLERYELKYLIPVALVEPISRDIEGHCSLDYFSQISEKNSYIINSLYFDTPNFMFIRQKKEGAEIGYSFRIRSYGADPKPPFYSEIKVKQNDFSNKMRAKIDGENWQEILKSGITPTSMDRQSEIYFQKFCSSLERFQMEPKILTQYRRKAYISQIDPYARVTFDRDLRFQREDQWNLQPCESAMCHYDNEDIFPHPEDNVILELKAEKKIPMWMIQLIQKYQLVRQGFSKYASAIIETNGVLDSPRDLISPWD